MRHSLIIICMLLCGGIQLVHGYISPFLYDELDDEARCVGLQADFAKLDNIKTEDLDQIQNPSGNRMFEITAVNRIKRHDGSLVLKDRVRLKEYIEGVKIRGAEVVVNFKGCNSFICAREVESLRGKTFRQINVSKGYSTNVTKADVISKIQRLFGASEDGIGELSLEVYASTSGDYLAYFTDVLVEKKPDYVRYFSIIIDAHNLNTLSICNLSGPFSNDIQRQEAKGGAKGGSTKGGRGGGDGGGRRKRKRRERGRFLGKDEPPPMSVNGISCGSCADDSKDVTWSDTNSACPVNTLYLNNAGRTTTCLQGTNSGGDTVYGAGPVPHLHWDGTQDCKSTTDECYTTIIPQCDDAISDVQFGAIKTMEYFQEYLGVMGGLKEGSDDPQSIGAKVHYSSQYCNAFYRYSANTVFFGDCDCSFWTPLTSIDIIAHEISHGVTKHTSGLEYEYQSGGMNEAFSDVVGAVVETLVNDSVDQPDFDVGEMLGNKLRNMENPTEGGRSIASVCSYKSNMDVHYTSGPLNKAFVNAVRTCQQSGCSDRAGCTVLLGSIFMYANIQLLTSYSGYLDGATATCSIVDEYFDAKSPVTECSVDSIVKFIRQGWASVNVAVDEKCQSVNCCSQPCPAVGNAPQFPTPAPVPGAPTAPQPTPPTGSQQSPNDPETPESPDEQGEGNIFSKIIGAIFSFFTSLFEWGPAGEED